MAWVNNCFDGQVMQVRNSSFLTIGILSGSHVTAHAFNPSDQQKAEAGGPQNSEDSLVFQRAPGHSVPRVMTLSPNRRFKDENEHGKCPLVLSGMPPVIKGMYFVLSTALGDGRLSQYHTPPFRTNHSWDCRDQALISQGSMQA